jgi:tetratricopeptide (TPR) repeat protein
MDVSSIFKSVSLAKSIGQYLGILESVSKKIDNLVKSEFDAAVRALGQALKSNKEQKSLLREARQRFNKAISLEKSERLALSYLGLALCHYHLLDYENTKQALENLLAVEIESPLKSVVLSENLPTKALAVVFPEWLFVGVSIERFALNSRIKQLDELQKSVEQILAKGF